jgi:hypothetical protein
LLRRALPDFLDLVVACLGGGLSVQAALKRVAEELKLAHAGLSSELGIVLREIEIGGSLDQALHKLATRTGLDELRTLRSFVQQTTKFGTTITDALAQLAEMLRIQREQRAEELAQKAAVKILFPTLLFIFPTVFVVLAGPAAIQIKEGLSESLATRPRSRDMQPQTRRRNRRVRRRRGATAAELAICLPLLILLCLTSVDFGRFAYAYLALGNAGRVGAEVGATRSYSAAGAADWQQAVEAAIREDFSTAGGLDPAQLVVAVDVARDSYGLDRITITTMYPFTTVANWPAVPRPLDIERTVTFRRFR